MSDLEAHAIWCQTVGCGCKVHHHHHDYTEPCFGTADGCKACAEAERRRDDEWDRPYRWVYDFGPPCFCDEPTKRTKGYELVLGGTE